jgi:hypothetical protein
MQFESTLNDPTEKTRLRRFIDPALKDEYPLDAVWKVGNYMIDGLVSELINRWLLVLMTWFMLYVDGSTGAAVHSGEPGTETQHEVCCGTTDDIGVGNTRVGSW